MDTRMFSVNHSLPLFGLMSVQPPSPASTERQVNPFEPELTESMAGEPLSCVPPKRVNWLVGCCWNHTNWVIEPIVPFRLSKAGVEILPFNASQNLGDCAVYELSVL